MLARAGAEQPGPHRHLGRQVKRMPRRRGHRRVQLARRDLVRPASSQSSSAGSRIFWYGSPSAAGKTVRSASWRTMTSRSAAPSAAGVQVAGQPQRGRAVVGRAGSFQLGDEPQPLLRERQRHPLGPRAGRPGPAARRPPRPAAPPARPPSGSRTAPATATSAPSAARIRLTSWTASSEWPPRAKKSSSTPPRAGRGPRRTPGTGSPPARWPGRGCRRAGRVVGRGEGRAGRACRWRSPAARRAPRPPRAPCSRAAARRRAAMMAVVSSPAAPGSGTT